MPGPDPRALWVERIDGTVRAVFECHRGAGNDGNPKARAFAMLRRITGGGWHCRWCGGDLPEWRGADAFFAVSLAASGLLGFVERQVKVKLPQNANRSPILKHGLPV
ncbi:MAG: hypothetical protein AAFY59_01995 [Pseudomonadota bacterium]